MAHPLRATGRHLRRALWRHVGRFLTPSRAPYARSRGRAPYLVVWQMAVDADSPEGAAWAAWDAQHGRDGRAAVFEVCDQWERWRTVVCHRDGALALDRDGAAAARPPLRTVRR
jgi:hypothetical protein